MVACRGFGDAVPGMSGVLGNTRKTVAVSSAPPQGLACSFLHWRRAAAPSALLMNATHENFRRELRNNGPSDRTFGLVFSAAVLFFGLWPLRHGKPIRIQCLALSGAVLLVALIWPSLLDRLNRAWTKAGKMLGKVVNPVVAGLLFYLVFTPCAIILRWMGRDLLEISSDSNAETYWIQRSAAANSCGMKNQF
jgi:saxitoxin biosynthesis operon SxtJ-like protein